MTRQDFTIDPAGQAGLRGYISTKARHMVELGPEKYREMDFFNQPRADLAPETLEKICHACTQLVEGVGFDEAQPLTGVGIPAFYALADTLHFDVAGQKVVHTEEGMLDFMKIQHRVSPDTCGVLFNLVDHAPEDVIRSYLK